MESLKGVSIVICCYNAESRIVPTLQHLQTQQFSQTIPWEVLVIDNASTDKTSENAANEWAKNPVTAFKVYKEKRPGLNHARDKGFKEALYNIVSLIDDDNWVEAHWVEKIYKIFEKRKAVGACGGQTKGVFESDPPEWFPHFQKSYVIGPQYFKEGIVKKEEAGNLWGAGLSIRKEIWQQLQEINFKYVTTDRKGKSLSCGGDTELSYAVRILGYDLYYTNDLCMQHFIPTARLQWGYVEKLHLEFGKSKIRNFIYFSYYHGERLKSWHVNLRHAIYNYYKRKLALYVKKDQVSKWKNKIWAIWWKGQIIQLLADRNKTKENYIQLQSTFSNKHDKLRKKILYE